MCVSLTHIPFRSLLLSLWNAVYGVEQARTDDMDRARTDYEEENFIRLPTTKKDKFKKRELQKAALRGNR